MHTWAGGVLWVSAAVRRDGWREAQLKRGAGHVGARRGAVLAERRARGGVAARAGWHRRRGMAGRRWLGRTPLAWRGRAFRCNPSGPLATTLPDSHDRAQNTNISNNPFSPFLLQDPQSKSVLRSTLFLHTHRLLCTARPKEPSSTPSEDSSRRSCTSPFRSPSSGLSGPTPETTTSTCTPRPVERSWNASTSRSALQTLILFIDSFICKVFI